MIPSPDDLGYDPEDVLGSPPEDPARAFCSVHRGTPISATLPCEFCHGPDLEADSEPVR